MSKRFTTWTDDTFWKQDAIKGGLVYGVYDNKNNCKFFIPGITITSYDQASKEAYRLNELIEDPSKQIIEPDYRKAVHFRFSEKTGNVKCFNGSAHIRSSFDIINVTCGKCIDLIKQENK
jgi:hypothetical protein